MRLVSRVSVFFLAALAVVLIVYSGVLYGFARARMRQQFEQELQGALNSLVAAIEVEPEEVKWQPLEHTIALGSLGGADQVQWAVIGDRQQLVETSRNSGPELITLAQSIAASDAGAALPAPDDWRVLHRRQAAPAPVHSERELDEFDELVVVVARSTATLRADLHRLGVLLTVLPVVSWLVSAAAGRWFCRRALQPVVDMSRQAGRMTGADFDSRLPVTHAGDELSDLAESFNTLLDRQHRAYERQRRFAADAAHELRTPLTVVRGQLDVALRRPRSAGEYAATLSLVREHAAQLERIVDSLLFLARAEEDAHLPDLETISLREWLTDYLRGWKDHPRQADLRLIDKDQAAALVSASPALLSRLLDNLIENALKYSEAGSAVVVRVQSDGRQVLLSVLDEGAGIAPEDQSAIFEPYFRTRTARDAGVAGSGLGLTIAARVAEALGGRLECTSELGRGSCFSVRLPTAGAGFETAGGPG